MKKFQKKTIPFLLFGLFFNIFVIHSQTTNKTLVLNWFDRNAGKEALPISNGTLHLNFDQTLDNEDRYYLLNKSIKGSIGYDSQEYFDINLEYDLFKDEIILKSQGNWNLTEVTLIKEKVQYFKLNGNKFVNLDINNQLPENFLSGYYEENLISKDFTFYIKHYKIKKEIIKDNNFYIDYTYKNEFVLFTQGKYNIINTKSQLLKFFPNYKNKINDYFLTNSKLKKENKVQFMKNLMSYIKSI